MCVNDASLLIVEIHADVFLNSYLVTRGSFWVTIKLKEKKNISITSNKKDLQYFYTCNGNKTIQKYLKKTTRDIL